MPEKIFRRRRKTADRGAFQVRMELVDNDDRFRSFCAMLNDAKRIAAMQKHGSHHGDVELSDRRGQIAGIPVINSRFGLQGGVTQPIGILQLLHYDSTWAEYLV